MWPLSQFDSVPKSDYMWNTGLKYVNASYSITVHLGCNAMMFLLQLVHFTWCATSNAKNLIIGIIFLTLYSPKFEKIKNLPTVLLKSLNFMSFLSMLIYRELLNHTWYHCKIAWIVLVHGDFFFFYAEFYRVVWTINALLTVRSEMLPFSGNNQNI